MASPSELHVKHNKMNDSPSFDIMQTVTTMLEHVTAAGAYASAIQSTVESFVKCQDCSSAHSS